LSSVPPVKREFYEYTTVRLVPCIERGEFINGGVVLYSQWSGFLGVRTFLDPERLRGLCADVDVDQVRAALHAWERMCEGVGQAGAEPPGRRFRWLTAPKSTIVQPGPVHGGLTADPAADLERLYGRLVLT
jgi:hypothetical protein